jgi:hypothetical protein
MRPHLDKIERADQERLLKLLGKHRKQLLKYPNVRSVDVGFEFTDGQPTGRLAIRVHVDEKKLEGELRAAERLPTEIDGIPVDVIESNPQPELVNRDTHVDPIVGGLTIGNTRAGFIGTLGAVVLDRDTLQPMALSNYHVMIVEPVTAFTVNDVIAQPNTMTTADGVGRLSRWDKPLDCAVCFVQGRPWETGLADLPNGPIGQAYPLIGTRVTKSGRTTAVTRGMIDGTSGSEFTVVPDPTNPNPTGEVSSPGDSGSVWIDSATSAALGLHFAGERDPAPSKERAWAKWMVSVTKKLNLIVFDGVAMSQCYIGRHATVIARTRPNAPCFLKVVYPSGRQSTAKGLGPATADATGWVRWLWLIGTSTKRHNAGTGHEMGDPVRAFVTLDGVDREVHRDLEGNPTTDI